jgi:serine O-acetyltransferase
MVPRHRGDSRVARPPMSAARLVWSDIKRCADADHKRLSPAEVANYLLTPGIGALATHRFAHAFYVRGLKLPARMLRLIGNALFGADIHEGTEIGPGCNMNHATGIVISGARIGANVTISPNVVLGARGWEEHERDGFPVVHDGVVIFTGAKVLGPIVIGKGAMIGANAVVLESVPDGMIASGVPARIVKAAPDRSFPTADSVGARAS